jgi:2-succinyl-6-hydroxy-2,4-cyclohexadiene-1-carboxylate synthase
MTQIRLDSTIHYNVEIAGSGEPLVLLHGFTGSSKTWFPVWNTLAQHFRVYAIDLPGHGQTFTPSTAQECEIYTVAEDLYAVIGELGLASFYLAGYSMGARMALYFASSYPPLLKGLILESGTPGLKTKDERLARRNDDNALADRIERGGLTAFVDYWENLPLWASQYKLPAETRAKLRQLRLQNRSLGLAASLRGMGTGTQPSLWENLPELAIPTLLITGDLDPKFTSIAEEMYTALPHAEWVRVPETGHHVNLEQPDIYTRAIIDFAQRHP